MSDSDNLAAAPRPFKPMTHNSAWWSGDDNDDVWSPFGQQRPMTAHLTVHNQGEDLCAAGARLEGHGFVTRSAAAMENAAKSITITVTAGKIEFKGSDQKMSTTDAPIVAPRIERPPASRFISVLGRFLTRAAFDRIIAPYVSQEQHEYYEALLRKDLPQAKLIRRRMYCLLVWLTVQAFVSPVIRLFTRAG
jgi:hypothetical protein